MPLPTKKLSLSLLLLFVFYTSIAQQPGIINTWLTDPANAIFFKKQSTQFPFRHKDTGKPASIIIDEKIAYQTIDGFGFALTGGSATHLLKMSPATRAALLKNLFGTGANDIGTSYLRLSIGASDLNEKVFSYDDLPDGETDPELTRFNLGPDKKNVIPVLKEILKINPSIKIMASPWSPPVWMKNNNDTRGGNLLLEFYLAYARYFVKYIQEMRKQGIRIDAVTVQNEPLHPGNNPSMQMLAQEQANFVKKHLGPAFADAKISTKIIIYDHNADKPEYPIEVLNDPEAKKYIDGSAFHLYGGKIEALSKVHEAHPDKNLYFTEQWVGAPGDFAKDIPFHIEQLIVGATRNWCKTVIEWNLSSDPKYQPHTDRGGCDRCLGAVTIDQNKVALNPAYYIIAHASKFVRPGSVRIASNTVEGLPNTAFKTPSGKTVLIVLNNTPSVRTFNIVMKQRSANVVLPAGAVATYIW